MTQTASSDEERNPVLVDEYDIKSDDNHANYRMRALVKMVNVKRALCWSLVVILAFVVGRLSSPSGSSSNKITASGVIRAGTKRGGAVLVTGATGRTGSRLYHELKERGVDVKAFVRDVEKAKERLGCEKCDETEGVFVGDVTDAEDLARAIKTASVTTLAIAVGATPSASLEMQRAIEFDSVVNSVKALGESHDETLAGLRVVLCSTIGTASTPAPAWSGNIEFWKLNAEAFLSTSGVTSTIVVKPCGLVDEPGRNSTLLIGHDDEFMKHTDRITISRDDVARVMAEAVVMQSDYRHFRFDLCSEPGPPTEDLNALIQSSRWDFDKN